MSRAHRLDRWRYRALLTLLAPLILAYTYWQGRRQRAAGYLRGRLALTPAYTKDRLWIHAASVGEVNAVLPLLRALRGRHPEWPLLVTTTTPTGAAALRAALGETIDHAFLPIDWPCRVRHFLELHRPRALLLVETELWPNLYAEVAARNLPLLILNARLSPRTLNAAPWLRRLYAETLGHVTRLLARDQADLERYLALGMPSARAEVLGNLKFAASDTPAPEPMVLGRDYLLLASSREAEERLIVEQWLKLPEPPLLVIAPRHPRRAEVILRDLAPFEQPVARRSLGEPVAAGTRIYLADTLGELGHLIAGARLVVMGGSFVAKGGHNLLEPAALGKAVIVGPHMENFASETARLKEAGGVLQLAGADELATALSKLWDDPLALARLGQQARSLMQREASVIERYMVAIQQALAT